MKKELEKKAQALIEKLNDVYAEQLEICTKFNNAKSRAERRYSGNRRKQLTKRIESIASKYFDITGKTPSFDYSMDMFVG